MAQGADRHRRKGGAVMTTYIGRCDSLTANDLGDYDDSAREISNRTFRRLIGREAYEELESDLGYGGWLRLSKDWHVSYSRGRWQGQPAVCCMWSAYHHIFSIDNQRKALNRD